MLSPEAYSYVTSQTGKYKKEHVPELRRRIKILFDNIFTHTLSPVLLSDELTQDFKNELFENKRMHDFLMDLIRYEKDSSFAEEQNKQLIAQDMLNFGLAYFETRYSQVAFISDKIRELKMLIDALNYLAMQQAEEQQVSQFYKTRGMMKLPPTVERHERTWNAMCRICWSHYSANTEKEAIKGIRHRKHCLYDKTQIKRCIEVFRPL